MLDESCEVVVKAAWEAVVGVSVQEKLEEVAKELMGWSRACFRDLAKQIEKG